MKPIPGMEKEQAERLASNIQSIITHFDEDPQREGLQDTPRRYIKFLQEFTNPPEFNFTTFKNEGTDQMVIVKDIDFYSLCEHHLAPFFGKGYIAYIPGERIVGLSKIPRVLDMFSRRFQNQERIATQVAEYLQEHLKPKGVAVALQAQHMCMSMRGVEKQNCWTVTSKLLGAFRDGPVRAEFFALINK